MIHQCGTLRRPAGLLSVSWTVTGSIKIKQDTEIDQDIVTIPVADWPALRDAIDAAIEARHNHQGAQAVSEAQSLTTKLDAHADWLEHVKEMPKNADLIREAVAHIRTLESQVYHTRPDEMMFGGEGWTWKQQARATEDRLKEAEARMEQLETAMTGTLGPLERCGLLAVADNVREVIGTRTTLGGTTNPSERARNP